MAVGTNPTKVSGGNKFAPRIQQTIDGWRKADPTSKKKMPVEVDVPEWLAERGRESFATERMRAVGDHALIAFYFLLRIGEYTCKGTRNESKQTVQFRMRDVVFFDKDKSGRPATLSRTASDDALLNAASGTLKLENQKNGWKDVCVHQEANGLDFLCPIRALARRYIHIRRNGGGPDTLLSAFFVEGKRDDVRDKDIRAGLKMAAAALDYPATRNIPVERVDTHSLRSGGANALALSGYSDTNIQKMGRWRGATFKEYISTELHRAASGMSRDMLRKFNFVNIASGAFCDVTPAALFADYDTCAGAA